MMQLNSITDRDGTTGHIAEHRVPTTGHLYLPLIINR